MPIVRILTALCVGGLCGLTIVHGWSVSRFAWAETALSSDSNLLEAIRPWAAVPGVAFAAREALLMDVGPPKDQTATLKRRNDLTDMLAVRPLSARYWLALAETRSVTGEDSNSVVEGLRLAVLTNPNQHYVMVGRGIFGVAHWEILPPELQRRTGADLAAEPLANRDITDLRLALSGKSEKMRHEILAVLQTEGVAAKDLVAIGF